MPLATGSSTRPPLRERAAGILLTLFIHLLLFALLLTLAPADLTRRLKEDTLATFTIAPADDKVADKPKPKGATKAAKQSGGGAPRQPAPPAQTQPKPPAEAVDLSKYMIVMKRSDFAAADIGKMASQRQSGSGQSSGPDDGAKAGPGEGPGGAPLYNAQWYREPTHAELVTYLPPRGAPAGSWATIACRTIDDYRVEDCRQLDESPIGSGLSKALRLASWQFRVRPPRIGGRPLIGSWVRIRFDFVATKEEE